MRLWMFVLGVAAWSSVAAGQQPQPSRDAQPKDLAQLAQAVTPSLVQVEYWLQYDKSDEPYGGGWSQRCPSCGQFHATDAERFIREERPAESPGLVLSPTVVLTADPLMHSRFIRQIMVRSGGQTVAARPVSHVVDGSLMMLELDQPLQHARPLVFDAAAKAPFTTITYAENGGTWMIGAQPLTSQTVVGDDGRRFVPAAAGTLIVDAQGAAVGVSRHDELALDDSWKGSPLQWNTITTEQLKAQMDALEASSGMALPRVHIVLRSPKADDRSGFDYFGSDDSRSMTEWHGSGVMLNETTVLVLANFKPDVTARVERITVHGPKGASGTATFKATLKDYGAFVATLDQPWSAAATLASGDVRTFRNQLLLCAEVQVQGEHRIAYFTPSRFTGFALGWGRNIYPQTAFAGDGEEFLFSRQGELIAIPIQRRQKVTVESDWRDDEFLLLPADQIQTMLANLELNSDPSNVPLSESEENRVAWLGVELQDLDEELARVNKVSDQTRDGAIGGLVTWVYENSPAATAGLEIGDIVLRLHVQGHPKPLDIEEPESDMYGASGFPWERLDELPEEYYDRIPAPWPSVDNDLHRKLTQMGYGTPVRIEFARDGEILWGEFTIVESPSHYKSAAKYDHEDLGVTVRDVTYEVRRYLQRQADDPGVIIARLEPGSRASVAGIKPFELITHVNDAPVHNVAEFEKAVAASGSGDLRLSIRRMLRGRIVKIAMNAPLPEAQEDGVDQDEDTGVDAADVDEQE